MFSVCRGLPEEAAVHRYLLSTHIIKDGKITTNNQTLSKLLLRLYKKAHTVLAYLIRIYVVRVLFARIT